MKIRERLIARGMKQKVTHVVVKRPWSFTIINKILRCNDYTGQATWTFGDGEEYTIEIPQIIKKDQFKRVQTRLDTNKKLSTRNAKTIYLLQGIAHCGDCGARATGIERRYFHRKLANGQYKKYYKKNPHSSRHYRCCVRSANKHLKHSSPYCWKVVEIDNEVWQYLVENAIKKPEIITRQVAAKQARLQTENDNFDGEIAKAHREIQNIDAERAFLTRQGRKGLITEEEFEQQMNETMEAQNYWDGEIERLTELRDNSSKVKAGLDYAYALLGEYRAKLVEINQSQEKLDSMPFEKRETILQRRQKIIRALCEKVYIFSDGRIEIEGVINGDSKDEVLQIDLPKPYFA